MKTIIKQAINQIRQQPFFSILSILGTAVSIAFAMLVVINYDIHIGDITPENNRSKMVFSGEGYSYMKKDHSNANSGMSYRTAKMIFNNVKGHPDAKVAIGLLADRKRVGMLLGEKPENLGKLLRNSVKNPIQPIVVGKEKAQCQEVVHYVTDPDFDIRKLVPAPTNTPEDAGPYITLGMCYASDTETGESDVTIHRLCLQSKDEITMFFTPGARHLGTFRERAEALGKPLPISISIGVDPAIEIASCFEPPTTPIGFNELSIAGAIRGKAVELVPCLTIDEKCIAHAEYVIEGELVVGRRMREDINTNTGKAMPEFPGYTGPANPEVPVIKVKAVTTRKNPIMQTCIGPSEEHVSMAGIPTEASIFDMVEKAMPGRLLNVYAASPGGGKFLAVLQFKKGVPSDEGRQRQAALLAFSAFPELKQVISDFFANLLIIRESHIFPL